MQGKKSYLFFIIILCIGSIVLFINKPQAWELWFASFVLDAIHNLLLVFDINVFKKFKSIYMFLPLFILGMVLIALYISMNNSWIGILGAISLTLAFNCAGASESEDSIDTE